MASWTHTLPGGGVIQVAVYRRDFDSQEAYIKGIANMMTLYPPDEDAQR